MYSIEDFRERRRRDNFAMEKLIVLHRMYFEEGFYRNMTWNEHKCRQYITDCLMDPDFEMHVLLLNDVQIVGFSAFQFTNRYMDETIAIGDAFYIHPDKRQRECSQMLLDFSLEVCYSRGASHFWQSSTAGFPDNGCNERAFRMLLKRNQFHVVGTSLVREL